jgi:hypothetical protein
MASLADIIPEYQGQIANQESMSAVDSGIQKQRINRNFAERTLPGLQNYYAGRGTFSSGHARLKADQATQDTADQSLDIDRLMARQGADLARKRLLATAGVFA